MRPVQVGEGGQGLPVPGGREGEGCSAEGRQGACPRGEARRGDQLGSGPGGIPPRGPSGVRRGGVAGAARKSAVGKVRVRVYGRKEAEAWKMGGLIAVGKGSEVSPRLIVAEYRGGRPGSPWTALVGKGVTFDTGGVSLKKGGGGGG